MSSQSKRRAESEEVSHQKKPRKGGGEKEEFKQGEVEGLDAEDVQDDVSALDNDNTIPVDIRTRGKRVDYTKVDLDDDNDFEARKEEVSEEKEKGVPPGARSPQKVLAEGAEEDDDDDDDEEEGEYGEDEDDDGTDDYEEDDEE